MQGPFDVDLPRSWESYPAYVREQVHSRELACVFERDGGEDLALAEALSRSATPGLLLGPVWGDELARWRRTRRVRAENARAKLDQFVASLPERRPPTPKEMADFEQRHAAQEREMDRRIAHLRGYTRRSQARKARSGPTVLPAPRRAVRGCQRPRGAGRPRAVARASSRGGDSGDSGSSEGDGEPAAARRQLHLVADLPARPARYAFACLTAEERGA